MVTLPPVGCLLYTSDAADDLIGVDLGGRRIIKKKNTKKQRYERTRSQMTVRMDTDDHMWIELHIHQL